MVRYHRRTGNVGWARTFLNNDNPSFTDTDADGNIYCTSDTRIQPLRPDFCKLTPNGHISWCSSLREDKKNYVDASVLRYIDSGRLVLIFGRAKAAIVSAETGGFEKVVKIGPARQFKIKKRIHVGASSKSACVITSETVERTSRKGPINPKFLTIHCNSLLTGEKRVRRVMDSLPGHKFFRFARLSFEPKWRISRRSAVYMMYERAFNFFTRSQKSPARHELVIQKMHQDTLADLSWSRGDKVHTKANSRKTFVFPRPNSKYSVASLINLRFCEERKLGCHIVRNYVGPYREIHCTR